MLIVLSAAGQGAHLHHEMMQGPCGPAARASELSELMHAHKSCQPSSTLSPGGHACTVHAAWAVPTVPPGAAELPKASMLAIVL